MRMEHIPYFQALVADKDRAVRLFCDLHDKQSDKAAALADAICSAARRTHDADQATQIKALIVALRDKLMVTVLGGDNYMSLYLFQHELGYFSNHRLNQVRRFIRDVNNNAWDADDVKERMVEDLDLTYCDGCDEYEYSSYMSETYADGERCRSCIEDNYSYLDRYDSYVHTDDIVTALDEDGDDVDICRSDGYFYYNREHARYVHRDYEPEDPSPIESYHSSKRRQTIQVDDWTKSNKRALGVELEVEVVNGADKHDIARDLHEIINEGVAGNKVFFENDGSLSNGFEIISQPMSLPAQRKLWEWLNNKSLIKNMRSHQTTTCGLHVHVSRAGLTSLQIAKMVAFVNNPDNENFIRSLARRYAEGFCRIKNKKIGKAHKSEDRYEALNVTPPKTVEFRLFKGSLKYESVISAIEFVNALVEYTKTCGDCSVSDLRHEPFMDFVQSKMAAECKTLVAYMTNRMEIA